MVVQRPAGGAPQNDEWRCEEALRVAGSTFTDSWDHLAGDRPLTRACELSRIAAAVRLLDRMGDLLDKAFADFEGQQRDHADSEKAKISAIVGRSRPERNEYLQQARAQIAAHERAAAEADAAGNPDLAKISRIQAATSRELISTVSNMGSITDTQGEIATLLVDSARFVEIAALRGDLHRARRKGRATRLRARWANPLAIGAVGLVAGVVATQIFQDEVADLSSLLPWVVAVVAWALLDYFVEPRLRIWLAGLQLKQMRKEVRLAFELWNSLVSVPPAPGQAHPLPAWEELREYTDSLPPPRL